MTFQVESTTSEVGPPASPVFFQVPGLPSSPTATPRLNPCGLQPPPQYPTRPTPPSAATAVDDMPAPRSKSNVHSDPVAILKPLGLCQIFWAPAIQEVMYLASAANGAMN